MPNGYANGFEEQPGDFLRSWLCGTYSFAHAMLLFGIPTEIDNAKRRCKTMALGDCIPEYLRHPIDSYFNRPGGTEERDLVNAIEKSGFTPVTFMESDIKKARSALVKFLQDGCPVILSLADGEHWALVAGIHDGRFVMIDSAPLTNDRSQVISLYTGDQLERYWWFECESCGGDGTVECEECEGDGWVWCGYCKKKGKAAATVTKKGGAIAARAKPKGS